MSNSRKPADELWGPIAKSNEQPDAAETTNTVGNTREAITTAFSGITSGFKEYDQARKMSADDYLAAHPKFDEFKRMASYHARDLDRIEAMEYLDKLEHEGGPEYKKVMDQYRELNLTDWVKYVLDLKNGNRMGPILKINLMSNK